VVSVAKESTSLLQASNPHVFKSLQQSLNGSSSSSANANARPSTAPSKHVLKKAESARPTATDATRTKPKSVNAQASPQETTNTDDVMTLPALDEAIEKLSALAIPKWSDEIDNDGVLAGIRCKFYSFSERISLDPSAYIIMSSQLSNDVAKTNGRDKPTHWLHSRE
jgi:hypothetical protein